MSPTPSCLRPLHGLCTAARSAIRKRNHRRAVLLARPRGETRDTLPCPPLFFKSYLSPAPSTKSSTSQSPSSFPPHFPQLYHAVKIDLSSLASANCQHCNCTQFCRPPWLAQLLTTFKGSLPNPLCLSNEPGHLLRRTPSPVDRILNSITSARLPTGNP